MKLAEWLGQNNGFPNYRSCSMIGLYLFRDIALALSTWRLRRV
jgi:hypothetical protein